MFQSSAHDNIEAIPCCVFCLHCSASENSTAKFLGTWCSISFFQSPTFIFNKALNRTGSWYDLILFVFIFVYCHSLIGKKLNQNKAFVFFILGLSIWHLSWSMGNELIWIILMHLTGGAWVSKGKVQSKPRVSNLECLSKQVSKPSSKQAPGK